MTTHFAWGLINCLCKLIFVWFFDSAKLMIMSRVLIKQLILTFFSAEMLPYLWHLLIKKLCYGLQDNRNQTNHSFILFLPRIDLEFD